ncbi:glucokinase regulatory-like protein [Priestia megaterium WSH-002]|uniref:Glucokinase regulatory-like protein n=1 Tax=Priestia megaterium (strain WSH-002) TaxID=1006007 RepID=A0A8D4BIJ5_PRIMW|nr:glucokinase regulatory-like protein [Priestia megaterium WSH-002]
MLEHLTTETRNEKTMNLDEMSIFDFLTTMNEEDEKVASAIKKELSSIAKAVEAIIEAKKQGGALFI